MHLLISYPELTRNFDCEKVDTVNLRLWAPPPEYKLPHAKKNMWVSGFPTLPSFWTSKSRP